MDEKQFKYMDEEERQLIEEIENTPIDQLKSVPPEEKRKIEQAITASRQSRQTKMNIRISAEDLEKIKEQAAREGLKYQSFVKSVLHKYITGRLTESDKRTG
jgi:predicted DNA binding CopG/RHH family protein